MPVRRGDIHLGGAELDRVVVIVLLLFGVNRIGKIGRELGTGIREFRTGPGNPDEADAKLEAK